MWAVAEADVPEVYVSGFSRLVNFPFGSCRLQDAD